MQIDKLYPTSGTPQYGIETTATFMNIPELVNDMGNQYLMGYVNSDDISLVAPVEIINGGDTVTMSQVNGNFGWGYAQWGYTGSYGPGTLYYNNNGTLTRSWGINYDFSFINAIEMARVNTQPVLIPYISVAAVKSELIDGNKMTRFGSIRNLEVQGTSLDNYVENTYTIDSWKNIIDNDLPIFSGNVTISNGGITMPLTLRPSDFERDNMKFALIPTDTEYTLHCRIMGLKIGYTQYYYDSSTTIRNNIMPFFQFPDIAENSAIVVPGTLLQAQVDLYYENGGIYITRGSMSGYYNEMFLQGGSEENSRVFGGFDFGTLSVNDIDFTAVLNNQPYDWGFVGNYTLQRAVVSGGQARFRVKEMWTPREIYNYVRFWHKRTDTPSDTYSTADNVTVFTNSNEPTLKTVSGTLSDIQLDLQPWQYPSIDITVNTFTPGNIPDSSGAGTNLLRFGNITPSEFLFGDVSIEKIYFGSSLLYQKFVPEQYVTLVPTDKFISEKASADDYRIYGPLPSGEIIISVRTPRVKNLLPYPYPGFSIDSPDIDTTIDARGVVSAGAGSVSQNYALVLSSYAGSADFQPPLIVPAGTYTASVRSDYASRSTGWRSQLCIWAFRATDPTYKLVDNVTDYDYSGWKGQITFTVNEPAIVMMTVYYGRGYTYVADTLYPQLEAGSMTEFEPVNPAILTTIMLPRALEETEYISYADQKIMPTGTPLVVPKLKTKVGENVIMIENYPTATNTITLTPATKE